MSKVHRRQVFVPTSIHEALNEAAFLLGQGISPLANAAVQWWLDQFELLGAPDSTVQLIKETFRRDSRKGDQGMQVCLTDKAHERLSAFIEKDDRLTLSAVAAFAARKYLTENAEIAREIEQARLAAIAKLQKPLLAGMS